MGYYIEILESTFTVPSENIEEAYETMCKLNFNVPNASKGGGSWGGEHPRSSAPENGPYPGTWFSWMLWNYHETCKDLREILEALQFEVDYNEDGDLIITGFYSKAGQEDLFLSSISHLAKGYIVWQGEDGRLWGETYGDKVVVRKERKEPPDYSDIVTY